MSSDPVISVRNVSKAFAEGESGLSALAHAFRPRPVAHATQVLHDISFDIHRGEAVGIIGRNGAGKSTLLKLISGVMNPSAGSVTRTGKLAALLELGAAFHPEFTGRENARFVSAVLGVRDADFDRIVQPIADFADIGAFFDRKVQEYSSGMYARLAFAVNLHCAPDIFIIDEALSVGDILFQFKCFTQLHRFRAAGGTLLIVSHDETAVRSLCDRVLWLDRGRLVAQGATDHVCGLYQASSAIAQATADPPSSGEGSGDKPAPPGDDTAPVASNAFDPDMLDAPLHPGSISDLHCWQDEASPGMLKGGRETSVSLRYCGPDLPGLKACFLLRDKMAQIVFGASRGLVRSHEDMMPVARFTFDLPYLVSGEYVIEALVMVVSEDGRQLVDRAAPFAVDVQTRHISHGLANLRMRAITLGLVPDPLSEAG